MIRISGNISILVTCDQPECLQRLYLRFALAQWDDPFRPGGERIAAKLAKHRWVARGTQTFCGEHTK